MGQSLYGYNGPKVRASIGKGIDIGNHQVGSQQEGSSQDFQKLSTLSGIRLNGKATCFALGLGKAVEKHGIANGGC